MNIRQKKKFMKKYGHKLWKNKRKLDRFFDPRVPFEHLMSHLPHDNELFETHRPIILTLDPEDDHILKWFRGLSRRHKYE